MLVIGENINASNRSVAEAISNRDRKFFEDLATAQASAGADFIDVNVGAGQISREHQIESMEWLIDVVQSVTDKPLTIDSDDPSIIEAALRKYRNERLIVNSVTAEPARLEAIGSLAAEHQTWLVALAMGDEGMPDSVEKTTGCLRCDNDLSYWIGHEGGADIV